MGRESGAQGFEQSALHLASSIGTWMVDSELGRRETKACQD